jgi:hypothetical protein
VLAAFRECLVGAKDSTFGASDKDSYQPLYEVSDAPECLRYARTGVIWQSRVGASRIFGKAAVDCHAGAVMKSDSLWKEDGGAGKVVGVPPGRWPAGKHAFVQA